jgi:hypothetical protein
MINDQRSAGSAKASIGVSKSRSNRVTFSPLASTKWWTVSSVLTSRCSATIKHLVCLLRSIAWHDGGTAPNSRRRRRTSRCWRRSDSCDVQSGRVMQRPIEHPGHQRRAISDSTDPWPSPRPPDSRRGSTLFAALRLDSRRVSAYSWSTGLQTTISRGHHDTDGIRRAARVPTWHCD